MVLDEKQKQTLTVGLIVAGMLAFIVGYSYMMFISPGKEENEKKVKTLQADIERQEKRFGVMQRYLENADERERLLEEMEIALRRLPSDEQAIEFLSVLQDSLRKSGVTFTRVSPEEVVRRAQYSEIPYSVTGTARYHEFGQFLNLIECNPNRFMRVSNFTLSNNNRRPSVHPVEVGIKTFMFRN